MRENLLSTSPLSLLYKKDSIKKKKNNSKNHRKIKNQNTKDPPIRRNILKLTCSSSFALPTLLNLWVT